MDDKVEDLLRRRTEIVAGGGEAKVEGQHRKGKKTARERIDSDFIRPLPALLRRGRMGSHRPGPADIRRDRLYNGDPGFPELA